MLRVPFENLSKLYYLKQGGLRSLIGLEDYLEGNERFRLGGTCYANNYHFYQLLAGLSYAASLCGADMSSPDVHLLSRVELEGREFLVDVGYAAPFMAPLPRDSTSDHEIRLGHDRYVLKPRDEAGRSRLELWRKDELVHGYLAKPAPRRIEEFEPAIANSFREEATFMNALLLARFFPEGSLVVHNFKVIRSEGRRVQVRTLSDQDELIHFIESEFGIPASITGPALAGMELDGDPWK
jgi:arylamine N-acetyltransferase